MRVSYSHRPQTMRKADKRITVAQARVQLMMLLVGARSIDHFTPEYLHRTNRVPLEECRRLLNEERLRRERLL